jgi:cardiolipin synthase
VLYLTIIGGAFIAWLVLVVMFTPGIPYHVESAIDPAGDHFIHVLESTCHTTLENGNRIDVLTNGTAFYPAMLDAIRHARESINMECYIFRRGQIGDGFVEALAERARAGVRVTLVMDAIGSFGAFHRSAAPLRAAGCRVQPYQRMRWYSLARLNNRTHRELLVVDGSIAFVGGAGIADWWAGPYRGRPMWRDTMVRIEGPVVSDIQGIVAENWLETEGEILTSEVIYKPHKAAGSSQAFAIKSSPSDRATASRVLFQTLLQCATRSVLITTPYFLPDKAFRRACAKAVERGTELTVIVPGNGTDQRWVRLASRRMYGELLRDGIRVFEYGRGMTHAKILLVDGLWAVVGTTNIDNRSFEHNDEVNVAIRDRSIVNRLTTDFRCDLQHSHETTLTDWERRPIFEKLIGHVAWFLERQQ